MSYSAVQESSQPKVWQSLDILRFLAAIAVLVWHYQNFSPVKANNIEELTSYQPLSNFFPLFYSHGFLAVQFFWTLSGFVLAHTYIKRDKSSFIRNRFARLYPLHLITLLVVFILQFYSNSNFGKSQIYESNDGKHFVLNLLFIPSIGLEDGFSFNGPAWSVTLELCAYLLFYLTLVCGRSGQISLILVFVTFGLSLWMHDSTNLIIDCIFFFNCGVLVQVFFTKFSRAVSLVSSVSLFTFFLLAKLYLNSKGISIYAIDLYLYSLFFCGLLLVAVLIERRFELMFDKRKTLIQFLGNLTFSSYMWHVPIQILVLVIAESKGISLQENLDSPLFLAGYLSITLIVARLSFIYIENPLRRHIRRP
jgi:peptidoglycan/LPS O-acetylase OafA/YrhL